MDLYAENCLPSLDDLCNLARCLFLCLDIGQSIGYSACGRHDVVRKVCELCKFEAYSCDGKPHSIALRP